MMALKRVKRENSAGKNVCKDFTVKPIITSIKLFGM